MLAASITRLQPAPTLAASTHGCSQHPHLQPALTLASSTHACSQHDTHPSLVHSRVFSNECNSNNFSRIQHNVFAASTHACSQHPRLQPAPTLAASTHACSQHPRMQPAHASRQHPRLQAAPTLAGSTHACCHHACLQPAPNACRRDFARQRTSISPRCLAFFLSLDSLPVQPAECVKGSSSLANALFPDSLGIQRLFPVQALFLRPPHLFLLWLSRSRCPPPRLENVENFRNF